MHTAIMVMGVSGCGKSTVGAALADTLGGVFLDGDDYHPQVNVAHMVSGQPLTDAMRWPWLDQLATAVNAQRAQSVTVFACSALRKSYRDRLRALIPDLKIAYLQAPQEVVASRMAQRQGHYMPATLLDSQLETLEVPLKAAVTVPIDQPVERIVTTIRSVV